MHIDVPPHRELARAGIGSKVGLYHRVLTASSNHGMQRRQARLAADFFARTEPVPLRSGKQSPPPDFHRWEDDGGSVRKGDAAMASDGMLGEAARATATNAVASKQATPT